MPVYPDIDLIYDFRNGKKAAFDELFERFYNTMFLFSQSLVNNKEEAKDIAIGSLTSLFRMHSNFESIPNIRAFLYVTTRNASINYLKFIKRREEKNDELQRVINNKTESTNDEIDGEFIRKIYHASINELPPRAKQVLEMLYEGELAYQEVANQLTISVHTVKNLRVFAVRKLREKMVAKGLTFELMDLIPCMIITIIFCQEVAIEAAKWSSARIVYLINS